MNENELDEILNQWTTPPVPTSLRQTVEASIAAKRRTRLRALLPRWRFVFAGAAVAVVVLLVANNSAFSRKAVQPPYTVESKINWYAGWKLGFGPESEVMTSYNESGTERLVSWSAPDHPWQAAVWTLHSAVSNTMGRVTRPFLVTPDEEARRETFAVVHQSAGQAWTIGSRSILLNSGCRSSGPDSKIVGEEVILDYPTVAVEYEFWKSKRTLWMAPNLSCFAMRARFEVQHQDGSWKILSEKQAVKVTVNR